MATQQAVPIEEPVSPSAEPPADLAGDPARRADSPESPRAGLSRDAGDPDTPPPGSSVSASAGSSAPPLEDVIAWQEEIFSARQPESRRMAEKAATALAGGVTSSWQITRPQPVWLSHGKGSRLYDVDGNEYVDLHGGYGASLAGHGHPAIVEAVRAQIAFGTHFAQPTRNALAVAEELSRRFGLPTWRFANSGTEATMDAVHLIRAITGRDLIIKVEGCYHGHHDSVQVSVSPESAEEAGRRTSRVACRPVPGYRGRSPT